MLQMYYVFFLIQKSEGRLSSVDFIIYPNSQHLVHKDNRKQNCVCVYACAL